MRFFFPIVLVLLTTQLVAQHRVEISDNTKYFEATNTGFDQAVKFKLFNIVNGSVGLNYEIALNDWFHMEAGAGVLLKSFNGQSMLSDILNDNAKDFGKGGYFLTVAPIINVNQDFLGDYWGIRTSYTYFHQSTYTDEVLVLNRFAVEMVGQYSFWDDFFAEISYGVGYQSYKGNNEFLPDNFLGLFNVGIGYLFN